MSMCAIQTVVNQKIHDSIEEGISKGKWKTKYEFLKNAITEKLKNEGLITD